MSVNREAFKKDDAPHQEVLEIKSEFSNEDQKTLEQLDSRRNAMRAWYPESFLGEIIEKNFNQGSKTLKDYFLENEQRADEDVRSNVVEKHSEGLK